MINMSNDRQIPASQLRLDSKDDLTVSVLAGTRPYPPFSS